MRSNANGVWLATPAVGVNGVTVSRPWLTAIAILGATGALSSCGDDATSPALPGAQAIVFVQRFDAPPGGFDRQVVDYTGQRRNDANGVMVLEPPTPSGTLRNLTGGLGAIDVNAIDLSFDAQTVVFSMATDADPSFHIYVARIDGSSPPRQLTFGEHDDVFPIFLPGDRIAFVTNEHYGEMGRRADEYNHSRNVGQIATISATLGDADRRRCAQNLSNTSRLFLLSDGRIGFARWEHLGPVNDVKLFAMNPDCTDMRALAGQHGKRANSLVQVREESPGVFVGIGTSRERTLNAGSLLRIDARIDGSAAVDAIELDEQGARMIELTPSVPVDEASPPSGAGRYMTPFPIERGDLLVSWADGDVNDRNELAGTAPNFGIYRFDDETRERTLVFDDPRSWDLYAMVVAPRDAPAARASTVSDDPQAPATIAGINVADTSLPETVDGAQFAGAPLDAALGQAVRVRIIEGFSSEIGPVGQFGLTMHEGAAILGETPVQSDGSWAAQIPSMVPVHLQPIDQYGMAIRNEMLWIQAMPGESRTCGGCHESRSAQIADLRSTIASSRVDTTTNRPIPQRIDLAWDDATRTLPAGLMPHDTIQDLFDAKCVSCHDGGDTYAVEVRTPDGTTHMQEIPYLDLSGDPLPAYFDGETLELSTSYVSLLYPAAMMGDSAPVTATPETRPRMWIVPGSARQSELIRRINVDSETDPGQWAWDRTQYPPHPEDVGGGPLTHEERLMLVRMADLGGQYFSRRNVGDGAQWEGAGDDYE